MQLLFVILHVLNMHKADSPLWLLFVIPLRIVLFTVAVVIVVLNCAHVRRRFRRWTFLVEVARYDGKWINIRAPSCVIGPFAGL